MSYSVNSEEILSNKEHYKFIPKHRSSSYIKASIWKITFEEEFILCDESIINNYVEKKMSYNLLKSTHKHQCLGINSKGQELYIGKFVNSNPYEWHGYPADYVSKKQDKPSTFVLEKMKNNELISEKDMRRICKGQKL